MQVTAGRGVDPVRQTVAAVNQHGRRTERVGGEDADVCRAGDADDVDLQSVVLEDTGRDLLGADPGPEELRVLDLGEHPGAGARRTEEAVLRVVGYGDLRAGLGDQIDLGRRVLDAVLLVVHVQVEGAVLEGDADHVDMALIEDDPGGGAGWDCQTGQSEQCHSGQSYFSHDFPFTDGRELKPLQEYCDGG